MEEKENGTSTRFVYHQGELLQEEREGGTKSYYLGSGIEAAQMGGEIYYYHQDEQLSTALLSDHVGKVRNHYRYSVFGEMLEGSESVGNRIRYTGQQYDEISDQYYLRARYYNPVVGRFLQEDVYQGDGLNPYAYCGNNPVMYYDPSGYTSTGTDEYANSLMRGDGGEGENIVEDHKKAILDALKEAPVEYRKNPKTGEMEPYLKQAQLTDEYIVLLRRDIGDFNHGDLEHWNLEVQTTHGNIKYDLHMYIAEDGNLLPFTTSSIRIPKKVHFIEVYMLLRKGLCIVS